jgi:HAD superfamily hydrolase (TIGR01484 family)
MPRLQPLTSMPRATRLAIRGVLADIDDTLTTRGRLEAPAYAALERLHGAGKQVVPITGRPAGWCDHIARMWPVDAVVGENGAFYMRYDPVTRKLRTHFAASLEERRANRARLAAIGERILAEVPGSALASDQQYREADIAIDFCEDVPPLPRAAVDRIVALMEAEGLTAKVSSIHVNGWFGRYDKLGMTCTLFADVFGVDLAAERERYVFAGDSPNDAPLFAYFPHAVGVANVRGFADRIATLPAYVTLKSADRASAAAPAKRASPASASSIRSTSFHLAMRSERANEPTLSCPALQPTARCAMDTSSVSPERAETIVPKPAARPASNAACASLRVPAWLGLISTALQERSAAACFTRAASVVR